jgi:hypothetical protein
MVAVPVLDSDYTARFIVQAEEGVVSGAAQFDQ